MNKRRGRQSESVVSEREKDRFDADSIAAVDGTSRGDVELFNSSPAHSFQRQGRTNYREGKIG